MGKKPEEVNKKPKNVLERFAEWLSLQSGNDMGILYDVMACLRGPDTKPNTPAVEDVKRRISCRIRYILGFHRPFVNMEPFTTEGEARLDLEEVDGHYAQHANDAIYHLQRLGYIKDAQEQEKTNP